MYRHFSFLFNSHRNLDLSVSGSLHRWSPHLSLFHIYINRLHFSSVTARYYSNLFNKCILIIADSKILEIHEGNDTWICNECKMTNWNLISPYFVIMLSFIQSVYFEYDLPQNIHIWCFCPFNSAIVNLFWTFSSWIIHEIPAHVWYELVFNYRQF